MDNGSTILYELLSSWKNRRYLESGAMRQTIGIDTLRPTSIYTTLSSSLRPSFLLLPVALHGEDLYEANAMDGCQNSNDAEKAGAKCVQDVDHIEFESDGLPDRVPGNSTRLSHTSVMQDFLSTD